MTSEKLLKAYAEGKRDFGGADLGGADLGGADLGGADLRGADLGGADLGGADLGGADLRGADLGAADLRSASLRGADLRGASLHGAYLSSAHLRGADLRSADLRGADLGGADLGDQWVIQGPSRSDGYFFFLMNLKGNEGPRVIAGCRNFTIEEAKNHWQSTRGGTQLGDESLTIIDHMVALAQIRKLSFEPVEE